MKTFAEFLEEIRKAAQSQMPEADVFFRTSEDPAGQTFLGLSVRPKGSRTQACFNFTELYQAHAEAGTLDQLPMQDILDNMKQVSSNMNTIGPDFIRSYNKVKPHLILDMVPVVGNQQLLKRVPHRVLGDIAVLYRVMVQGADHTALSTVVTHKLLQEYGISADQVHRDAIVSEMVWNPPVLERLPDTVSRQTGGLYCPEGSPLWVATVKDGHHGAVVMQMPEFLDACAAHMGDSFYILPSSVHEVLFLRDRDSLGRSALETMVREVNSHIPDDPDFLSNTVFHYDSKARLLETVEDYERRVPEPDRARLVPPTRQGQQRKSRGGEAR